MTMRPIPYELAMKKIEAELQNAERQRLVPRPQRTSAFVASGSRWLRRFAGRLSDPVAASSPPNTEHIRPAGA